MQYKKVLDNIEPFNDLFYQSCFFNSFFPITNHFKVSILPIIINYINLYKLTQRNGNFTLDILYFPDKPFEQLISELGIETDAKKHSNDLLNDIEISITNNRPVILWIDCFYEPNRSDTYLKMHLPHTLLVYGYDSLKQECNIIEHKHFENLSYEYMVVEFEDIIKSYNGFNDNFIKQMNIPSYNEYYLKTLDWQEKDEKQSYLLNFIKIIRKNRERYDCSLKALEEYRNIFNYNCSNEVYFKNNSKLLVKSLCDIINAKRAEKYLLRNLFDKSNIIFFIDKIVDNWIFIREKIALYMFSSIYKEEVFESSAQKIDEINEFENRLLKMFLNYRA